MTRLRRRLRTVALLLAVVAVVLLAHYNAGLSGWIAAICMYVAGALIGLVADTDRPDS